MCNVICLFEYIWMNFFEANVCHIECMQFGKILKITDWSFSELAMYETNGKDPAVIYFIPIK